MNLINNGLLLLVMLVCESWSSSRDCKRMQSCSDCIRTPTCVWCGKTGNFTSKGKNLPRCRRQGSDGSKWQNICARENIYGIDNDIKIVVLANQELSTAENEETIIQLKPQHFANSLGEAREQFMRVKFRQVETYPLDVYYLVDLSITLLDGKERLLNLGTSLVHEMLRITNKLRIGFGFFGDNFTLPYVTSDAESDQKLCDTCPLTTGFRNVLSLTDNVAEFVEKVSEAQVSASHDIPNGGLDAIMQVLMCQEEIGWSPEARRILLFVTDSGFHQAGDSKLGGTVQPNDMKCHLDSRGEYTHSGNLDYPSVAQINKAVMDHRMNIIFAVTAEYSHLYSLLSEKIVGSSREEFTSEPSDIIFSVKAEYFKIVSKVELKHNATDPVSIRFFSKCKGRTERETHECQGLRTGDEVYFRLEVFLSRCPDDKKDWKQLISIYPVGLPDRLLIDLTMLCDCPCENPGNKGYIEDAEGCNNRGSSQCGICKCNANTFGQRCECDGSNLLDNADCRRGDSWAECSGRGKCHCGVCQCNERDNADEIVDGKYCECTNYECPHHPGNGLLCGGPDHGQCICNECKCKVGWKGIACDCQDSQDWCFSPGSNILCSGNGECECNLCDCNETVDGQYSGQYCEKPPLQVCQRECKSYEACVQCQLSFQDGAIAEECETKCIDVFNITMVPIAPESDCTCTLLIENGCKFTFVYSYKKDKEAVILVQNTPECPFVTDVFRIVFGVTGAVFSIALILLMMRKIIMAQRN